MSTTVTKKERIDLRVIPSTKNLLVYVAESMNMSLSSFILECAYSKAQEIISSKTQFILTEKQWQDFNKLLDKPPRNIPQLKKLFQEKSIFNE